MTRACQIIKQQTHYLSVSVKTSVARLHLLLNASSPWHRSRSVSMRGKGLNPLVLPFKCSLLRLTKSSCLRIRVFAVDFLVNGFRNILMAAPLHYSFCGVRSKAIDACPMKKRLKKPPHTLMSSLSTPHKSGE